MTISNETVINKMMEQLQEAKASLNDHSVMLNHISNVKLLSELLLDEYAEESQNNEQRTLTNEISMEKIYTNKVISNKVDKEEDGTSIFDF